MTNVFVSRPTWVPPNFEKGLQGFLSRLGDFQMRPRTLGASDHPNKAPLDEVIQLLDECQGIIVLGFPQIEVCSGSLKGRPLTQTIQLPTEWNHIEAGLAYARGLPMLLIHHEGVCRGVFDRGR